MQSDVVVVIALGSAFLASSPRLLAMLARSASGPINDDDNAGYSIKQILQPCDSTAR
jgi:hypothetical protein